jgi:hypothetical protein
MTRQKYTKILIFFHYVDIPGRNLQERCECFVDKAKEDSKFRGNVGRLDLGGTGTPVQLLLGYEKRFNRSVDALSDKQRFTNYMRSQKTRDP